TSYNNNFVNSATSSSATAIYFSATGIGSNYNNLYSASSTLGFYSSNQADLAAWQSITSQDANSISEDPFFYADTNLRFYNPALDSAGQYNASVPNDILGNPRNTSGSDIGAYELQLGAFSAVDSFTYSLGDIPTQYQGVLKNSVCPTSFTVNIPPGSNVTGIDVSYQFTATNGAWLSEQFSFLKCISTGQQEANHTAGPPTSAPGTYSYNKI